MAQMVKRLLLHNKDKFDKRDHILPMLFPTPPRGSITTISMMQFLGPVRDQGQAGSCTGQASAGFLDWLYKMQTKYFVGRMAPTDMFSALQIYAEERINNGDFPADNGSDSRTAFRVLNQLGACLNSVMPYSDTQIALVPNTQACANAATFKIGAYHRVLLDDNLQSFRGCLASGYCRIIGIPVYEGIDSDECATTGMLPIPKTTDTPIGGHELLVYGYDDTKQVELVRNSWGTNWGLGGNLTIPYAYYSAVGGNDAMDSWTAHMGKPWK